LSRDIPADAGFLCDKVAQAQGHNKNDTSIDFIMGSRGVSWAIPEMTCYRREIRPSWGRLLAILQGW